MNTTAERIDPETRADMFSEIDRGDALTMLAYLSACVPAEVFARAYQAAKKTHPATAGAG